MRFPWNRTLGEFWFDLFLVASGLMVIFLNRWTSSWGPYFFPPYDMNPDQMPRVPHYLLATNQAIALLPLSIVIGVCLFLSRFQATNLSRGILKGVLLILGIRYFIWRTSVTLNFTNATSSIFSIILYASEIIAFLSFLLYTVQSIFTTTDKRTLQADGFAEQVGTTYNPTVDVLVPTHNEDIAIVRRTIIGCQAMEYVNKTVYILNDGYDKDELTKSEQRDRDLQKMAEELNCKYIYYTENEYKKKASNLNHALTKTQGELVVVMDADFIPFSNFLTRTIGFFDPDFFDLDWRRKPIDLVQTPQHFYNPDYHCRNLGLEGTLPNDMEHFYHLLQPNRDMHNGVICCGSSYVVRRSALDRVNGFYPKCCVEDFQTSLRLLCQGSKIVFLNEILSMGESPRTYSEFINQRLRWLQGNVQAYFCGKEIPIWSKLNFFQLSFLISQGLHCLQSIVRIVFLLSPFISLFTGISPVLAPWQSVCFFFLPFWVLLVVTYGWAAEYRVSYLWNEIYEVGLCFPAFCMLFKLIWQWNPFSKVNTNVTLKQQQIDRRQYNWEHLWPLWGLLVSTVGLGLIRVIGGQTGAWQKLGDNTPALIFWMIYNTIILVVAILSGIDQIETRTEGGDRFPLNIQCSLTPDDASNYSIPAQTSNLSEGGACLLLDGHHDFLGAERLTLNISGENDLSTDDIFSIQANVIDYERSTTSCETKLRVKFIDEITTPQRRSLVQRLYSQKYDFHQPKPPTTIDSTLAVLKSIVLLQPLMTADQRNLSESSTTGGSAG